METSIEVRYAGVVVGRTAHAREVDAQGGRGPGLFVGIAEPLPVGTLVTLKIGDTVREARVDEVVEAADPSSVGMRVVFDTAAGAAFTPPPRAAVMAPAPAPAVVAVPVVAINTAPSGDAAPSGGDAPSAAVAAEAEASEAISAPLSLADPAGGNGKKRRKRR